MKNLIPAILFLFIIIYINSLCDEDVPTKTNKTKTETKATPWQEEDNSAMAYLMMEDFVKRLLKSPGSAKFPNIFVRSDHTKRSGQTYEIISYVDSQSAFGALLRTKFFGVIKKVSKDEWELVELKLFD